MKLLMTADTVGGVWTYALELATALRVRRVEVTLVALGPPLSLDQRRGARQARIPLYARECALEWMEEPWTELERTAEWLLDVAARVRPDVVHANDYASARLPWRVPSVVVGHSCVLSWYEAVRGRPAPPAWARYRRVVAEGIAAAAAVAAPTGWMLHELERLYGARGERVVIPNGRSAAAFPPRRKEPFVLAAGRLWDEAKNVDAVDRVAASLPWPVVLAGDQGTWRATAARPLGRLAPVELAAWLARASIFTLPARYEPFGLGPLEAALAECALVLGDIPSLREVWGDAALYVDPRDDDALAATLARLIRDDSLRRSLALAARRRALTYTPERMAEAYLDLYERVATAALDELPVGAA